MNRMRSIGLVVASTLVFAGLALSVAAQQEKEKEKPKIGHKDTPMLPGGKWHVHDGDRPQPVIISAGTSSTQEAAGKPPSDAVVLFDGTDLSKWIGRDGKTAAWKIEDGAMVIPARGEAGSGAIKTKDAFGDFQLHIEWATPTPPKGRDQGRGNSGVEIFGRYEIQVLDSFDNQTYPDGQAASIYGQYPPLVNASRPPGQWQTYDIVFSAPRFDAEGKLKSPAYITLFHNGVLMHNHAQVLGAVAHAAQPKYTKHAPKGPIQLQDHGNPVRYRNIWIRELKDYDQP